MAAKKNPAGRHRVVPVPAGNVPSAVVADVSEGGASRLGITLDIAEGGPKPRKRRKRKPR